MGALRGTWRGSFTGDPQGYVEEGSGDLQGDSFTGDPGRYVEKALETTVSFHRGRAGEPGSFTRDIKRWMEGSRNGTSLSKGALRENCRKGSFTGDPERYAN